MAELDNWLVKLTENPAEGWPAFYKKMLGHPLLDSSRLFKGIEMYGAESMFSAITASAFKQFKDDPLPYVMATARNMWEESRDEKIREEKYQRQIERIKAESLRAGEEIDEQVEIARKIYDTVSK